MAKVVLLVEDDHDLRELLALALPYFGAFQVVTAENGDIGLEKACEIMPDCIVLDVKMPGLNGLAVARALRGDSATANIPIVILSAMAQDFDMFAGFASGADRYLLKPTKPQTIAAAIVESMDIAAAERDRMYNEFAQRSEEWNENT